MQHTYAVANQKGGVGKTTTVRSTAAVLAEDGYKVLCVDMDPQGSLTTAFGVKEKGKLETTIYDVMSAVIQDTEYPDARIKVDDRIDLIPANIKLSGMELALVSAFRREAVLKDYLETIKDQYDYILIDCGPTMGLFLVNVLMAADNVIIPVAPDYLADDGLESFMGTVRMIQKRMNPNLQISGILYTIVEVGTIIDRNTKKHIGETYGNEVRIFDTQIPKRTKVKEAPSTGESILTYDKRNDAAAAYRQLVQEMLTPKAYIKPKSL